MHLSEALRRILAPHPTTTDMQPYVALTIRIATVYLHKRIHARTIHPDFFGLSVHDLAVDCIGPLYERDGSGRFVQLHAYYTPLGWDSLSEEELLSFTRRLVYSKVHQQLSRLYKESDPSLEKILRNIRNAIRKNSRLTEDRRNGELWVQVTTETEHIRQLPEIPWEYLEGLLVVDLSGKSVMPEVMDRVACILDQQNIYRRSYPLTLLGLLIRTAFLRIGVATTPEETDTSSAIRPEELEAAITGTVTAVFDKKHRLYVEKGTVAETTFSAYREAVQAILRAEFILNDGHATSYHDHLAAGIPLLTLEQYHQEHRCRFEYLVKLARAAFVRQIRRELGIGKVP